MPQRMGARRSNFEKKQTIQKNRRTPRSQDRKAENHPHISVVPAWEGFASPPEASAAIRVSPLEENTSVFFGVRGTAVTPFPGTIPPFSFLL